MIIAGGYNIYPEIAWTDHVEKQLMQQLQQIAQ